jgi:hypothetical protein
MEHDKFIEELDIQLWNKGTLFKSGSALKESLFAVIKNYLLKKNLIIVSRAEYEKLLENQKP